MKIFAVPIFAAAVLISFAQIPPGGGTDPETSLPYCGTWIQDISEPDTAVQAVNNSDCDGTAPWNLKNSFKNKRTKTTKRFTEASKYYCTSWSPDGCDFGGTQSLPNCPAHECTTNP